MRLFLGIEIPDEVKEEILLLQEHRFPFNWQTWDQFHLTLHFLGNTHHLTCQELISRLHSFHFTPFTIALKGAQLLGSGSSPHSLCLRTHPDEDLMKLQKQTGKLIRHMGISLERRDYIPHVTLARFGRNSKLRGAGEFLVENSLYHSSEFVVSHFSLFESRAGLNGSIYTVVERFGSIPDHFADWNDVI